MRILVVFNPISGLGRAAAAGQSVSEALRRAGHDVEITHTRLEPAGQWLDPALSQRELMVVLGGDGAVRMAAPAAVRCGCPIYHFPQGTENLFAREFGMKADSQVLLAAIERGRVHRVDVARANGEFFLLMASIGFDAEVVHDLASVRGKSISHLSYLPPIARQMIRWRPPVLEIEVDGSPLPTKGPGFIVVGNSRQYGWRLDPCCGASMEDGLLDVAFFPASGRIGLAVWAIRCRLQRHGRHPRLIQARGKSVKIRSQAMFRHQLDGDPPRADGKVGLPDEPYSLRIEIEPACLGVLAPVANK